jgi:peptidylprolyl isomerase
MALLKIHSTARGNQMKQILMSLLLSVGLLSCGSSTERNQEIVAPPTAAELKAPAKPIGNLDLEDTLYLDLKTGRVVIKLRPDLAPNHVERIKKLTREGFYNGLKFHRVIAGFMVQTGDPKGNGTGQSQYPDLKAEFSSTPFNKGTVGAARSASPDSANSQFYIMLGRSPHLDNQYTVWGEVVQGMGFVTRIKLGDKSKNGTVTNPDIIVKMQVAADAK